MDHLHGSEFMEIPPLFLLLGKKIVDCGPGLALD